MSRGATLLLAAVGVLVLVAAGAVVAVFVVLPSRGKTAATATTPAPTPAETPTPTATPEPEPEPEPTPEPVSAEPVVLAPPPAPPPTAAPRGASSTSRGTGSYCVQLGAFRVEGNAQRLAAAAHEQGLEVRIVRIVRDGEPLFRVRTSLQPSRADAEAMARHVANRMGIEGWVTRSRAT